MPRLRGGGVSRARDLARLHLDHAAAVARTVQSRAKHMTAYLEACAFKDVVEAETGAGSPETAAAFDLVQQHWRNFCATVR